MTDVWREGARSGDPQDECPACHAARCIFASDFKLMGKHSIRACIPCGRVFDNGKEKGWLAVTPPPGMESM